MRILEILEEFGLKATWFIPAQMIEEHSKTIERYWTGGMRLPTMDMTIRDFTVIRRSSRNILVNARIFPKVYGKPAYGMRPTGALLPETELWLYDQGGFRYSSAGTSGEGRGWYYVDEIRTKGINVPCRDEQMDDYVQTVLNSYPAVLEGMPRIAPYDVVYGNWVREVEGMIRYGNSGSSAFHPQIGGTPGRAVLLEKFCRYLADNQEIWCATCLEIADYHRRMLEDEAHA